MYATIYMKNGLSIDFKENHILNGQTYKDVADKISFEDFVSCTLTSNDSISEIRKQTVSGNAVIKEYVLFLKNDEISHIVVRSR